jgi:hypothetical protein
MIAATKKNRILGTPKRNISMLPTANKAPAMPVPPGILEMLIYPSYSQLLNNFPIYRIATRSRSRVAAAC